MADHDEHKEKRWYQKIFDWDDKEECGACHFAYQPELLPSGSWEKILAGIEDHFGNDVESLPALQISGESLVHGSAVVQTPYGELTISPPCYKECKLIPFLNRLPARRDWRPIVRGAS